MSDVENQLYLSIGQISLHSYRELRHQLQKDITGSYCRNTELQGNVVDNQTKASMDTHTKYSPILKPPWTISHYSNFFMHGINGINFRNWCPNFKLSLPTTLCEIVSYLYFSFTEELKKYFKCGIREIHTCSMTKKNGQGCSTPCSLMRAFYFVP